MEPRDDGSAARAWHALAPAEALSATRSSTTGLDEAEAARRLARDGPNELPSVPPTSAWRILWRQLRGFGVLLLLVATGVALWSGDRVDAVVIAAVLVVNVGMGFATELKARSAMDSLRRLQTPWAFVVRHGRSARVEARALVVGDVVELDAGNTVPADARLLRGIELRTVESTLTGESAPVSKTADLVVRGDTPLADRRNMVYGSTIVAAGRGSAVVVATGASMEVGRIGLLVRGMADEVTPLERRLATLSAQLTLVAVAVAVVVGALAWMGDQPMATVLELALAMAVAAIPEGLPAVVTITLAVGTRRMARRHALVRRLAAVETIGSAGVVCTDKTGTLTSGEQTVTAIWVPDREIAVTGSGYTPAGEFIEDGASVDVRLDGQLRDLLCAGALANRAALDEGPDGWEAHGDPTDIALLAAAEKAGIDRAVEAARLPDLGELPFSSERMFMATYHASEGGGVIAMLKGAPARVLPRCAQLRTRTGDVPLDAPASAAVRERNARFAAGSLRVLAIATGPVASAAEQDPGGLTLLGLVGLTDPLSPGVLETVQALRAAGVRTVMLTGDQQGTAAAIGRALGIAGDDAAVLDGAAVARLSDAQLADAVVRTALYSRISAEDKLRVIRALRGRGEIVAMLGDGVNDAAALRQADVGIAMGRRGTDVAKEAAGVVLADDRFATVAAAVEEGRVIFDNIRKCVLYLVSCNLAEIITIIGARAVGLPLPVTPLQILWLNLVTDSLPALALALEPPDEDVMRRPPRDPREPIISLRTGAYVVRWAALIAAVTVAALVIALRVHPGAPALAVTMSFTTLALAQLFHLGNARRTGAVTGLRAMLANRYALAALGITVALQVAAASLSGFAALIDAVPLGGRDWVIVFALALLPAIVGQTAKLLRGRGAVRA